MPAIHDQAISRQSSITGTARVKLRHTDLDAADTTQVLTWDELLRVYGRGERVPPNAIITSAEILVISQFTGGGASSATIALGDAADPDELVTAADVFGAVVPALVDADGVLTLPSAREVAAYGAQLTVGCDVNVSLLTAGALEARITYRASETTSRI